MDAKDLRADSAVGDCNNEGNKYVPSVVADRGKQYQDVGSNTLAKMDVQTSRPCAVIEPDRVLPSSTPNDPFLKRAPNEPWPFSDLYRRPPEYPHNIEDYQNPIRNISPRQTFQENMPRVMVPPRYNITKSNENPNCPMDRVKNFRLNMPPEAKYCDVPYTVNINEQKNICIPTVNRGLPRNVSDRWPPAVNVHPARSYAAQELYQFPDYPSCTAPRTTSMNRPQRTVHDVHGHVLPDTYFPDGSVRLKPYPPMKERYPTPRYDYINNYSGPYNPPYKYDLQKSVPPHSYPTYPVISPKYIDNRLPETIPDGFQRLPHNQQVNYNVPFRNQVIHPLYGPMGNGMQNKMFPYLSDGSVKTSNKIPLDVNNKQYIDYENIRAKAYPTPNGYYNHELSRQSVKNQVTLPSYPTGNMHPHYPYFRKDGAMMKNYEYIPPIRNVDPSMHLSSKLPPHQFSPNLIAMSPSDSNTSIDALQGHPLEDYGYVNQSSVTSARTMDIPLRSLDFYKNCEYRYGQAIRASPMISKPEGNSASGDNKNLDVRQFLQMWNEGDDESGDNTNKDVVVKSSNDVGEFTRQCGINKNPEELYVLGLVKNVPSEELSKYEHIQKVSKLPENIKGYTSIELLNQFEEAIESSKLDNFNTKLCAPKETHSYSKVSSSSIQQIDYLSRPMSPLDVEAKISQSVIHKDVGCNFEIKPCSPKMLNVEIAAPVQTLLAERAIEKVANPLMKSPLMIPNADPCKIMKHKNSRASSSENTKVPSCQIVNTQFLDATDVTKTNYTLQDLESSSGVSLASLPRLDNDIEFSFPEINQQFINANKIEDVMGMPKDLPSLDDHLNNDDDTTKVENLSQLEKRTSYTFSTEINCDNEFTKLSKYRRVKADLENKLSSNIQNNKAQIMRTDSVIIMNPENAMGIEVNEKLKSTVNLTLNNEQITQNIIKATNEFQSNPGNPDEQQNMAIDFSLSSLDSNMSAERNIIPMKDKREYNETRKDEHSRKKHDSDQVKVYNMVPHVNTDNGKDNFTIDNFNIDDINGTTSDAHTNQDFKDIVCQSSSKENQEEEHLNTNSTANFAKLVEDQDNSFHGLYYFNEESDIKNNKEISSDLHIHSKHEKENVDESSTRINQSEKMEVEEIRNSLLNSDHLGTITGREKCCKNKITDPFEIQLPDSKNFQIKDVENVTKTPCDYEYEKTTNGTERISIYPSNNQQTIKSDHITDQLTNYIDFPTHSIDKPIEVVSTSDKIKIKPFVKIWRKELNSPRIQNLLIHNIDFNKDSSNKSFYLPTVQSNNEEVNDEMIIPKKSDSCYDDTSPLPQGDLTTSTKDNFSLDKPSQIHERESDEETKKIFTKLGRNIEADVLRTLDCNNENKDDCVCETSKQEIQSKKECRFDLKYTKNYASDDTEAKALPSNQLDSKNLLTGNEENLLSSNYKVDAMVNSNERNYDLSQSTTSLLMNSKINVVLPDKDNYLGDISIERENEVAIEGESKVPTTELKGETNHSDKYSVESEEVILSNSVPITAEIDDNGIVEKMVGDMDSSKENKNLADTKEFGSVTDESNNIPLVTPDKMRFISIIKNVEESIQREDNLKDEKDHSNQYSNDSQKIINESSSSNTKEVVENNINNEGDIRNITSLKEDEKSVTEKCGSVTDEIKKNISAKSEKIKSFSVEDCDNILKSKDNSKNGDSVELKIIRNSSDKNAINSENININVSSNTEEQDENKISDGENLSSIAEDTNVTNREVSSEIPEKLKLMSVEQLDNKIIKKDDNLKGQNCVLGIKNEPKHCDNFALDSENISINNLSMSNTEKIEENNVIYMETNLIDKNRNLAGENSENLTDTVTSMYSNEKTKLNSDKEIDDKILEDKKNLRCVNFESPELESRVLSPSDYLRNLNEHSNIEVFTDSVRSVVKDDTGDFNGTGDILLCTDKETFNPVIKLISNEITEKPNMEESSQKTESVDDLEQNAIKRVSPFVCDRMKVESHDGNIETSSIEEINKNSNDGSLPLLEVQNVRAFNIDPGLSREDENNMLETNPVFQDDSCLKNIKKCNRKSLKRSLSDSELYTSFDSNEEQDIHENIGPKKRRKIEHQFTAENFCNLIHNQRRNSISTVYNPENVSFCILIDNDCFDNDETQNLCFTEMPGNGSPKECIETDVETLVDYSQNEDINFVNSDDTDLINSDSFILENDYDKDVNETWVDDIACVETVVSDDMVDDMLINDSYSPGEHEINFQCNSDFSEGGDGTLNCNIDDHMNKVKHIYGDIMSSDGEDLVKTLYSTPQMNVNKALFNKENVTEDEHCNESYTLENKLPEAGNRSPYLTSFNKTLLSCFNSEESLVDILANNHERKEHIVDIILKVDEKRDTIVTKQTQDDTVNSCESSVDNVFSYEKIEDPLNCVSSCSPEVSSTTSEDKNSGGILLKITNYRGSRISEIKDTNSINNNRINCKYTENNHYLPHDNNSSMSRPLITKGAQKYIPPLKEIIPDFKVKLSLPQKSLLKLKLLKMSKRIIKPDIKLEIDTSQCDMRKTYPKKLKPKFEDVLKSIDEIQFKKHKEKTKKTKTTIPKVVIKKNGNGSHYATQDRETFDPDMTGRKWQPWVFIEKNNFIDKMAIKNKTKAVFSHRKNTYVLTEKFKKYKSVSNKKFIISQPKLDEKSKGHLKYTIRLKQAY